MKKFVALALVGTALPMVPFRAEAQAQALPAAVSACYANPVVCTVVVGGAAGTWLLIRNGRTKVCTWDGCQPYVERGRARERGEVAPGQRVRGDRRQTPGESRIEEDLTNIPGVREVHYVTDFRRCYAMERNFKQQGLQLKMRFRRSPMPGARLGAHCIFEGSDADPNRFVDQRYNNPDEYR